MIRVFVMETCPDCTRVKEQAKDDPRFEIVDIGRHVRDLKQFLALRDSSPAFAEVRRRGSVGIPCFVLDDGSITFNPDDARLRLEEPEEKAPSCSIDGKGC